MSKCVDRIHAILITKVTMITKYCSDESLSSG